MSRFIRLGAIVILVGITASSASATEATIVPGVGIGKVKLGMMRAQVTRILGPSATVEAQQTISGAQYVELGWNFDSWTVGFLRNHVVQVGTELRSQRTTSRIGPGTFWLKLVKAYPGGVCTFGEHALEYLVPHGGGTQTIFFLDVWPPRAGTYYGSPPPKTFFVRSATVRTPYKALPEFAHDYPDRCKPGWQTAPLPKFR